MDWQKLLSSIFDLRARHGWILLLGGVGIHYLPAIGFPEARLPDPWGAAPLWFAAVGAAILAVAAFGWVAGKLSAVSYSVTKAAKRQQELAQLGLEAVDNVRLLDDRGKRALVWILRAGDQRFSANPMDAVVNSLHRSLIIYPASQSRQDIFMVRKEVWAMREELLKTYKPLETERDAPFARQFFTGGF